MNVQQCPHCGIHIVVDAVNCGIFRCGVYKDNFNQVNPHLSEEECAALTGLIWGCGKPFRLTATGALEKCGYL
jgi:hypothetical protein